MNFALGIVDQFSITPVDTYGYVELSINQLSWAPTESQAVENNFSLGFRSLALRPCTEIDLQDNFYPVRPSSEEFTRTMFKSSLTCLADKSDLSLYGSSYEIEGQIVTISIKTCKGHNYCRSEDEINKFVETHSLMMFYNQQQYNTEGYGEH